MVDAASRGLPGGQDKSFCPLTLEVLHVKAGHNVVGIVQWLPNWFETRSIGRQDYKVGHLFSPGVIGCRPGQESQSVSSQQRRKIRSEIPKAGSFLCLGEKYAMKPNRGEGEENQGNPSRQ